MIHIYSAELTNRMDYIFRLIFESVLGEQVDFYQNVKAFSTKTGVKINYSSNSKIEGLILQPNSLLFEKDIKPQSCNVFEWESLPVFFETDGSFLPFDIFAASFYLVSRYEEYLPGKRDRYNRFLSRNSLASQHHFLEKPLINCWSWTMANIIEQQYNECNFTKSKFRYIPTFDIDNAWAFKHKGLLRNTASSIKDLLSGRFKSIGKRFSVLLASGKDPYDTYDYISSLVKANHFQPVIFVLINNKGQHDRSLSHKNKSFRRLIRSLSKWSEVGIHPSYSSEKNEKLLSKEIKQLDEILNKETRSSRQHYLKIMFPKTYRRLLDNGIDTDYSLGYASRPGFRASICTPFHFFDLTENETTSLTIIPFQVMDGTLLRYRNLSPNEATKKIATLMNEVATVGGTFVSLWHNESLCDQGEWKGWKQVYDDMTKLASELSK